MSGIDRGRRRNFVPLNTQESVDSLYLDSGPFGVKNQGWRESNTEGDDSPGDQNLAQVKEHKTKYMFV